MPEIDVIVYGLGGFDPGRPDKNIIRREKAELPEAVPDEVSQLRGEIAALTEEITKLKDKPKAADAPAGPRVALTDVLAASNGPDFPFVPTGV